MSERTFLIGLACHIAGNDHRHGHINPIPRERTPFGEWFPGLFAGLAIFYAIAVLWL